MRCRVINFKQTKYFKLFWYYFNNIITTSWYNKLCFGWE